YGGSAVDLRSAAVRQIGLGRRSGWRVVGPVAVNGPVPGVGNVPIGRLRDRRRNHGADGKQHRKHQNAADQRADHIAPRLQAASLACDCRQRRWPSTLPPRAPVRALRVMAIDTNAWAPEWPRPEIPAASVSAPTPAHSTGALARNQFALVSSAPITRRLWLRR